METIENTRARAAAGQRAALAREQEFMSLAEGVGCIPEKFRNQAYSKLDFEPGEGGFGTAGARRDVGTPGDPSIRGFLAAIAAGADPQQYAQELLGGETKTTATGRPRRTREAS